MLTQMKTYFEIRSELLRLKQVIEFTDKESLPKQQDWGGADVIITGEPTDSQKEWRGSQPIVLSFQNTKARRRLIVTSFHGELSWLFFQMRGLFSEYLDYISKCDFYGSLADGLCKSKTMTASKYFFQSVVDAALEFLEDLHRSKKFGEKCWTPTCLPAQAPRC